ncbi:hypothetical protein dqs_0605 [Azoarcus olearius]|uniref:hypothetical protein n=1 Tax=Azoarcus sp. (strain BH72) TaxID=418699 RepID=UPI0008061341|nr:hypothetical protein [Azoarcus olearius]ANQ83681.1 hypothetical protein dqs_0605 [Azoarcus olearius]
MSPVAQYVAQVGDASRLVLAIALLAAGAAAGGWLVALVKDAEIADLRTEHAEFSEKLVRRALDRYQVAKARGDELTAQLAAANTTATALQKDLADALTHITTGRRCLDGAALRLLDRAPGIAPARLPTAAGVAPAADAAHAAADTAQRAAGDEAATDTDVSLWATGAAGEYGKCVRQLDALIDFNTPSSGDLQ